MTEPVAGEQQVCDLLIRNAYVISMDANRSVFPAGAIAIADRTILAVGPEHSVVPHFRPSRIIDAHGAVAHPGFIDPHYHATVHLARGVVSEAPGRGAVPATGATSAKTIGDYSVWFNALDDEAEQASSMLACLEMVRAGFTCFMDPGTVFEPDIAAGAAEALGMRASVADPFLWDVEGPLGMASEIDRAPASLSRSLDRLGGQLWRNDDPLALVRGHVAVYGRGSVSDELALAAKARARAHQVVYTAHQNLEPNGTNDEDKISGRHVLVHFGELGLLDELTTFAHMNVIRDDEVRVVLESGMSVAWQPGGYLFYGISSQVTNRLAELHDQGLNVTFAVDTSKIWTFGDIGRIAYLVARSTNHYFSPEAIFEMQTLGAARAIGMDKLVGSLEPGKRADLVIRSDDLAEAQPGISLLIELLFTSRSQSVDTVIIDGRIVLKGRHSTLVDEGVVYESARAAARRIAAQTGLSQEASWPLVT